jgi:hypothetical protein
MDLSFENRRLGRVVVKSVSGYPGVGFFRLNLILEFSFQPQAEPVQVIALGGNLFVKAREQELAVGRLEAPLEPVSLDAGQTHYPHEQVLSIDLDRARLEALEALRCGQGLNFSVGLWGQVASKQGSLGRLIAGNESYHANQSTWLEVLRQMRYAETMLIELPAGDGHPALAIAQKAIGLGHYREAVGACRDVLEALSINLGERNDKDPEFAPLFANSREKDKEARLRTLRRALIIMTHPARHSDEVSARFEWDREDATAAIAMTAAVMRWQTQAKC